MRRTLAALTVAVFGVAFLAAAPSGARVADPATAAAMASSAERFLDALSAEQRAQAVFPFEGEERLRWHFIPGEVFPRRGLPLASMDERQRALAHDLLRSGLSEPGYLTATAVLELEGVLRELEAGGRFTRDPERYFVSVFGTPSATGAWGWRFEGHHISLHFTVVEGREVAAAPAFVGANPAEVREGPRAGLRILAPREEAARALVESLTPAQRFSAALVDEPPDDILTGNQLEIGRFEGEGIPGSRLDAAQREHLLSLIEVYVSMMPDAIAAERMARIREAGLGAVTFLWIGDVARGAPHYYRIQGPSFLVEYDNAQDDGNHIHSVWRDFAGDFGRDVLREHLAAVAH